MEGGGVREACFGFSVLCSVPYPLSVSRPYIWGAVGGAVAVAAGIGRFDLLSGFGQKFVNIVLFL